TRGGHRAVRLASSPSDAPNLATLSLDSGIRPESNMSPGGLSGTTDGETSAHLRNPGLRIGTEKECTHENHDPQASSCGLPVTSLSSLDASSSIGRSVAAASNQRAAGGKPSIEAAQGTTRWGRPVGTGSVLG